MKNELVKAHELIDKKKVFVAEGELVIAESLEDIITMSETGEVTEEELVGHFNASRRIEFQRKLKAKPSQKTEAVAKVRKLEAAAKDNAELAKILREAGFTV